MNKILGEIISFVTTDKLILNGVWFGKKNNKTAVIFIHGLGGSIFSRLEIVSSLGKGKVSVLTFNNRGSGNINGFKKIDKTKAKGYGKFLAGEWHEIFTECVHDIEGAIQFSKSCGAKKIYLFGHSTGCQKIIYYLAQKNNQKSITGAILACPLSDWSISQKYNDKKMMRRAEKKARELVKKGKPHELLPKNIWPYGHDAQRFLSLHTPDSKEEIFTYAQPDKKPKTLQKVKIPVLGIFAGNDEFNDRPTQEIVSWFEKNTGENFSSVTIFKADHSFTGKNKSIENVIQRYIKKNGF